MIELRPWSPAANLDKYEVLPSSITTAMTTVDLQSASKTTINEQSTHSSNIQQVLPKVFNTVFLNTYVHVYFLYLPILNLNSTLKYRIKLTSDNNNFVLQYETESSNYRSTRIKVFVRNLFFLVTCNLGSTFTRLNAVPFLANLADFGILVTFCNVK